MLIVKGSIDKYPAIQVITLTNLIHTYTMVCRRSLEQSLSKLLVSSVCFDLILQLAQQAANL